MADAWDLGEADPELIEHFLKLMAAMAAMAAIGNQVQS